MNHYVRGLPFDVNHDLILLNQLISNENNEKPIFLKIKENHLEVTQEKTENVSREILYDHMQRLAKEVKKDPNITPQEKSIKLNSISEISRAIFNHEKDFVELKEHLDENLFNFQIQILPDNPFYGTDLIVLQNDYSKILPLNAILEDEFNEITTLISELKQKGKFRSLALSGKPLLELSLNDPENEQLFKTEVINMISELCRRRIGRDIIKTLTDQKNAITICPTKSEKFGFNFGPNVITLNLDLYIATNTYKGLSDEKPNKDEFEYTPSFIILAHECIHAIHFFADQDRFLKHHTTPLPLIRTLEEQSTIMGRDEIDYALASPNHDLDKEMETSADWDETLERFQSTSQLENVSSWIEKSENGVRAAFGISPRAYPYEGKSESKMMKIPHIMLSIATNKEIDIKKTFTLMFKKFVEAEWGWQKFLNDAALEAALAGRLSLVRELIEEGALIPQDLLNQKALQAINANQKNALECFIALGADPNIENTEKES